jgi:hypothetical protein
MINTEYQRLIEDQIHRINIGQHKVRSARNLQELIAAMDEVDRAQKRLDELRRSYETFEEGITHARPSV